MDRHSVQVRSRRKGMKISGEQLTKPFGSSGKGRPPKDTTESLGQVQMDSETNCQQASTKQSRAAIANSGANKMNLNQKSLLGKTRDRTNNRGRISASHLHSHGLLENTCSSVLKQKSSPVVQRSANKGGEAPSSHISSNPAADKLKHKKSARQKQDGASNWMRLCATLHIDGTKRKNKPVKRTSSPDDTEQGEQSQVKRTKPGIWFDSVDKILIEAEQSGLPAGGNQQVTGALVKPDSFQGVTNCVAMDCEMVGVGPQGQDSILARVSIVNHFGVCLYDKFVQPREKVTDFRTYVSGVTPELLATGEEFTKVQSEVSDLISGRILVGHAVHNDLKVLLLTHPHKLIRDTSLYKPFRELFSGRLPSLKKLTDKVLGVKVQEGQHSSVQDAQATMRLYTMHRQQWEKRIRQDRKRGTRSKSNKSQPQQNSLM
ncbi:hypothetical protein BsWGS_13800 [Bradybaena similaris]